MRPLYITMTAFGPYAGRQEIDFSDLKGRNFFLIHGPTGSGKTTILDAMCYALYGATSGDMRTGETMRSHHAGPATATEVMFDFAIGSNYYRVRRRPRQEVAKDRGKGTKLDQAQAGLYELDSDRQELKLLASKSVTEEVEKLLGFKENQFRQVVLLPQGDFRKLLLASSTERQDIMQTLFRTGLYRQVEQKLKEKNAIWLNCYGDLGREINGLLTASQVTTMAELQVLCNEHIAARQTLLAEAETTGKMAAEANNALAQAKNDQDRLKEAQEAAVDLAEWEAKIPAVDAKRVEVDRAKRAAALADLENSLMQLTGETVEAERRVHQQEQQVKIAEKEYEQAQAVYTAEQACEAERAETLAYKHFLDGLADKSSQLTAAIKDIKVKEQKLTTAQALWDQAKTGLAAVEGQLVDLLKEYDQTATLGAAALPCKMELDRLLVVQENRRKLDDQKEKLASLDIRLAQTDAFCLAKEEQFEGAKARLTELFNLRWQGQAAALAQSLMSGQPCPVCGSTDHPTKATASAELPSEADVKAQENRCTQLEKEKEIARQAALNERSERDALAKLIDGTMESLGVDGLIPMTTLADSLTAARKAYDQAQQAVKLMLELKQKENELEEQKAKLFDESTAAEANYHQAASDVKAAKAILEEREKALPVEFRDGAVLAEATIAATKKVLQFEKALQMAREGAEKAKINLAAVKTSLERFVELWRDRQAKLATARETFNLRLVTAEFKDDGDYQAAKMSAQELTKWEQGIINFDRKLAASRERNERAQTAAAGLVLPDITALEKDLAEKNSAHITVMSEINRLASLVEQEKRWLIDLGRLEQERTAAEGKLRIYTALNEIASGKDTGVTFERFVLGALLDEVAVAANARLKDMSRGRYLLQRKTSREDRRLSTGLDLEVYDNYTGFARQANTLSGGETFLASLSLALGLADVVQSYAGGIHLDTIFVDEGFGTLDPETLDFAVKALLELQQGGRLVGIISHVPELKERIDARLEISLTARGSKAEFKVG